MLSKSVADSIVTCRLIKIDGFADCSATVEFLRIFNEAFDLLNCNNPIGKGLKAPLKASELGNARTKVSRIQNYIENLRITKKKKIVESQKKTGFLGIQQGLEAALGLADMLLVNVPKPLNKLKYLLMYKLSQDHLEHFFSRIRAPNKLGFNNNPTCRLFQVAYKAQLLHAEVKISTGNCCLVEENLSSNGK